MAEEIFSKDTRASLLEQIRAKMQEEGHSGSLCADISSCAACREYIAAVVQEHSPRTVKTHEVLSVRLPAWVVPVELEVRSDRFRG